MLSLSNPYIGDDLKIVLQLRKRFGRADGDDFKKKVALRTI